MDDGRRTGLNVQPIAGGLGARIVGARLQDLVPSHGEEILAALHKHQLLVFENQSLSPADFAAFGAMTGPIQKHVLEQFRLPEDPDIFIISNVKKDGQPIGQTDGGFEWHTDMAFAEHPMAATMLYALEVPPEGSDTLYASTYRAYESLPEEERARYRPLDVTHSLEMLYRGRKHQPQDQERKLWPEVTHPLVRTHPATGREGFYLGLRQTKAIAGMEDADALALIDRLVAMIVQDGLVYRHKWQKGDVVIWDNRGLLHAATPYDKDRYTRHMWRISVRGERPFRAESPRSVA